MAYKTIHETFWTDPKLKKKLTPIDRYLFCYFITCPSAHFSGLFYLPKKLISDETGISDRGIDRGMDTLMHTQIIRYDDERDIVFVRKMLKYQIKDANLTETQKQGLINHFNKLHNTPLIKDFLDFWSHLKLDYFYTPMDTPMDTPMSGVSQIPVNVNVTDIVTDKKETEKSKKFKKPTIEEIKKYCEQRKNGIDAESFFHFYESKNWLIGKTPMKSWQSAIITWEKNQPQTEKRSYEED